MKSRELTYRLEPRTASKTTRALNDASINRRFCAISSDLRRTNHDAPVIPDPDPIFHLSPWSKKRGPLQIHGER